MRSWTRRRGSALALTAIVLLVATLGSADGYSSFWRCLRAGQTTLALGAVAAGVALVVGLALGALAGAGPRLFDALLARAVELSGLLPSVLLLGLLGVRTGGDLLLHAIALGSLRGIALARVLRGEIFRVAAEPFTTGARALGASNLDLLTRHWLPHLRGPLAVTLALIIPYVVGVDAALAFLGLLPAGRAPTWGTVLGTSWDFAGGFALLCVLATTAACHGLLDEPRRQALADPGRNDR